MGCAFWGERGGLVALSVNAGTQLFLLSDVIQGLSLLAGQLR